MVYSDAPKRPRGRTAALVLKWTRAGLGPRDVASKVGISTQAVYKHIYRLRAAGELPDEEGAA